MLSPDNINLIWEVATGYDFFASIHVLHQPSNFGLRGAWAKGVRSRLPGKFRAFFEETADHFLAPMPWVYTLPAPKDSETILNEISKLEPAERFLAVLQSEGMPRNAEPLLRSIVERAAWTPAEQDEMAAIARANDYPMPADKISRMLDMWANSQAHGEIMLDALAAYHEVFFAEEEGRIRPALLQAVEEAQEIAAKLPLSELLVELSEGIRFEEDNLRPEMVMIPSFWISPLVMMNPISATQSLFLFGGRPDDAALVPGDAVPDALFRALKALTDPTRLRILRYLEEQPLTPTELAGKLRLRAPTVIHHLNNLRLAGLVYVDFGKGDKRYAARLSRVDEMYGQLRRYLVKRPRGESAPKDLGDINEQAPRVA